jgi:hypothetical protein
MLVCCGLWPSLDLSEISHHAISNQQRWSANFATAQKKNSQLKVSYLYPIQEMVRYGTGLLQQTLQPHRKRTPNQRCPTYTLYKKWSDMALACCTGKEIPTKGILPIPYTRNGQI